MDKRAAIQPPVWKAPQKPRPAEPGGADAGRLPPHGGALTDGASAIVTPEQVGEVGAQRGVICPM